MSELDDHILASPGESMLLAAQALPTSSPINVISTASVVPAPTATQFSREFNPIQSNFICVTTQVKTGTLRHL